MDPISLTVGSSWILIGVLSLVLAIPLVRGRVKPNPLYGVRFRESFQSEEAWFAINRYGGRRMAIWAMPIIALGLVVLFLPLRTNTALTLILGFGPLLLVLAPVLQTWRFARHFQPRA
jgi:hypothetical protein